MTDKIDEWLFEHAQIQGHICTGIKNEEGVNIAWKDETTGETIETGYAKSTIEGE